MPGYGRGQGRFRRGWIESFVLLIIAEEPAHGYEIANKLSDFGVILSGIGQMGNLYRTLAKLEDMGLLLLIGTQLILGHQRKYTRLQKME
ncbi:PadR family transcriptional regulator [Marinitoga lauensis]|uniref:PadR family transcriptional regulator n=1 Tax=Marinitoga lauensis TaxID=2201189 RepID=UPI00197EF2F6|nr:PadR family transcriptional regulator [Marinitoga lauensis]